jgi:hypothetical protein
MWEKGERLRLRRFLLQLSRYNMIVNEIQMCNFDTSLTEVKRGTADGFLFFLVKQHVIECESSTFSHHFLSRENTQTFDRGTWSICLNNIAS